VQAVGIGARIVILDRQFTDDRIDGSQAIVAATYQLLMARAESISDPRWRQSFLEDVPSNRAVIKRWSGTYKGR
jgi:hypothetical protein